MPDNPIADAVRRSLANTAAQNPGMCFGHPFHFFATIDSTMTEAARLAVNGAPTGTLVLAEEQLAGRGRHGRQWISEPGAGLYLTLVLRPPLPPAQTPIMTLMAGVSLVRALMPFAPQGMDLRWPNDLLIHERKCAGILVEMRAEQERVDYVLVGIGINVNQTLFPEGLETPPTSLLLEAGRPVQRLDVLNSVLRRLEEDYNSLLANGAQAIREQFTAISSYATGKRVRVGDAEPYFTGITAGLTPEGILLVRREDGKLEKIIAGHVRPA